MFSSIRLATEHDAEAIHAIYAPVVRDTPITFEWEPPTVDEMQQRMVRTLATLPWLVCEHNGDVLGYVYAGKHSERTAYGPSMCRYISMRRRGGWALDVRCTPRCLPR